MTDWQPIETAPKDGFVILLWQGGYPVAARWIESRSDWVPVKGAKLTGAPEAWMPLLNGPKAPEWLATLDSALLD